MPRSPQFIDNPHSDRVRKIAELASPKARRKAGRFLIEGPQAVREASLHHPDIVTDIYMDTQAADNTDISEAAERSQTMYVHEVSTEVLRRMSPDAQSVLAVARSEGFVTPREQVPVQDQGRGLIAACWQVRDPGNEGTVIRTADASGCAAVILVGECVDPLNPKVIRSTAGSLFHIPVCRMSEDEFFEWVAENGLQLWAADIHGTPGNPPHDLSEVAFAGNENVNGNAKKTVGESADAESAGSAGSVSDGSSRSLSLSEKKPTVVLFGNEARGLPSEMVERADATLKIPLFGAAESLNLAMSSAVLLYTLAMSSRVGRM